MANEKTWYTWTDYPCPDVSSVAGQLKSFMWILKAMLKGEITGPNVGPEGAAPSSSNWTVYYSCDGATAGTANDGVDRWGATYDATKLVTTTAAAAHSWMVVKSPAALGPYYLCLDLVSANASWGNIAFAKTAFTGGTTTARPTSTDEVTWLAGQMVDSNPWSVPGGRYHRCIDANGNFWLFSSKNGSNSITGAYGVQTLKNLRMASDTWPVVGCFEYNASGALKYGSGSSVLGGTSAVIKGRNYNGSAVCVFPMVGLDYQASVSVWTAMSGLFSGDGLVDTFPCTLFSATASNNGFKGDFYDMKQVLASAIVAGARYPATGTQEKTVVGSCLVPLSVVPSL